MSRFYHSVVTGYRGIFRGNIVFTFRLTLNSGGMSKNPFSPVMSDLPVFTNITANLEGPSPGPTSILIGFVKSVDDGFAEGLSVQ